uniref:Uncharacterized protein n=1 Tax=Mycena chlorophos TaxID=658473 RepID=A0ABQ0LIN8_MYCCL|nr:predicted protein [Mycena chlorophos]
MGDELEYMGTATVVRDMDVMAEALDGKGAKSKCRGASILRVGAYLVNMLPDRVARVVIDGAVDPIGWASKRFIFFAIPDTNSYYKTNAIIKKSLREELTSDVSLLTVADRLQTSKDSAASWFLSPEKILKEPLKSEGGKLRALIDESGDREILVYVLSATTRDAMHGASEESEPSSNNDQLSFAAPYPQGPAGPLGIRNPARVERVPCSSSPSCARKRQLASAPRFISSAHRLIHERRSMKVGAHGTAAPSIGSGANRCCECRPHGVEVVQELRLPLACSAPASQPYTFKSGGGNQLTASVASPTSISSNGLHLRNHPLPRLWQFQFQASILQPAASHYRAEPELSAPPLQARSINCGFTGRETAAPRDVHDNTNQQDANPLENAGEYSTA